MSDHAAAAPKPPRKRRRWGAIALIALLALLAALAIGAWWIVATPGGAQLVLARAAGALGKGTKIEGVEGRLGGVLKVKSIEIDQPDLFVHIDDVEIESSSLFGGRLVVHRFIARNVEVRTASSKAAARVPVSFTPPYPITLEDGRIGTLRLGRIEPAEKEAKDLAARLTARDAARAKDTVLRDVAVKGEGDKSRWNIADAAAATEFGTVRIAGTLGNASPFAVDVKGTFDGAVREHPVRVAASVGGTLQTLEANLEAAIDGTRATAKALLTPFADNAWKSVSVHAADVDLSRIVATLPKTRLSLEATLAPQGNGVAGPVRLVNAEAGPWDLQRFPFSSASARIVATAERADLAELNVVLLGGGSANGSAAVAKSGIDASLRVSDVDLAALHGALQRTRIAGRVAIQAQGGTERFDLSLRDPRFEVEGRAAIANEKLEVESARVATGAGSVEGNGGMMLDGRKAFHFEGRAQHFDPAAFVKIAKGDMSFTFATTGTLADGVAGEAKIEIAASTYAGLPATGRIAVTGDRRRIASADIDVGLGEAHLTAKGSFGRAGDVMEMTFRAPDLAVVAKPFDVALAGRLEGTASLSGTFQSPAGRVALTGANLALPSDVFVRELTLRLQAGVEAESPVEGSLQARGLAIGKDVAPTAIADTLAATLHGTRIAHRLELDAAMARDTSVRGVFQGGLDPKSASLAWSGRVESFSMTGRGAFALAAPALLAASASRVELGDATLRGDWGEVHLATTRWTPRTLDLKGATGGLQVQNVARSFRLATIPRSDLTVAGDWDIHAADTFEGSLNVRRVSGDLRAGEPPLPLGLRDLALHVDAVRGRAKATAGVTGDRIGTIAGEGAALIVRGASGWQFAKDAPVEGRLVADIPDLATLAPWLGPDAKLGGHASANLALSGTGDDPRVSGDARAENLVVREPQTGFEVSQGQVALRVAGKSLAIERFAAKTPWHPSDAARARMRGISIPPDGGSITAEGSIDLAAHQGVIRVKAEQVPVTQLPTRFVALSGESRLEAGPSGVIATGAFKVDAGWVGALAEALPSVSDDVVVVRASQPAPAAEFGGKKESMRIDLQVSLNDHVWFQGRGLDTRLTGDVRVTGDVGGTLRANGTIRTEGGTYDGYGQKLAIERGVLTFSGPLDNPRLNVLALRKGLPVEAGVEILGTTTRPRVRLVSSPDVPEPEKLSWLVLGRGASDSSPGDSSVLLAAASALLGNNNPGSDLSKRFGIDEVKIGRADTLSNLGVLPASTVAGRTGTASASEVVSVGKRLNRDLQLNYEQGLADAEGALKLTWRISRQFQVLVRAGFLPGVDAVYRWTFK
jgi:translocation and assembly module TamB